MGVDFAFDVEVKAGAVRLRVSVGERAADPARRAAAGPVLRGRSVSGRPRPVAPGAHDDDSADPPEPTL
jgi:hypothetical protein